MEEQISSISKLHSLGQSIWYDNIQRHLLENDELASMISREEIRGVTSNPSIFQNAIAKSHDYDLALIPMAWSGWKAEDIFYQLAIEDIQTAASLFLPLYESTQGGDGYVSLEVSPNLAHDFEGTFKEAQRLWKVVNRPNLMIKIPATIEGIPAIRMAIAAGLNVNVTLIFSLERYDQVIDAYLSGLEERVKEGLPLSRIASVASFFVSRVDTKVDGELKRISEAKGVNGEKASALMGKAAIANAKEAYALFKTQFGSERFKVLRTKGANPQRPLWASTSTKNPNYRDVMYVEELIGPNTVNTVPPQTLEAFKDHGNARRSLEDGLEKALLVSKQLEELGISMRKVTSELEQEGVKAFSDAYQSLLKTIDEQRNKTQEELGSLKDSILNRVKQLESDRVNKRLFAEDPTLWTDNPAGQAEIRKRLGWLSIPENREIIIENLKVNFSNIQESNYTHALLLGMGGSSLAPEVLRMIFGVEEGNAGGVPGLDLAILDSTDPRQVRAAARRSSIDHTLYIVSSKSGSTSEISALLDYFWTRAYKRLGEKTGNHFVAITDPGTSLESLALEKHFVHVFQADPNVGGRYSALTAFGLVPAAFMGIDVRRLLESSYAVQRQCTDDLPIARNPGIVLGAVIGQAALDGRDKLTIIADPGVGPFGAWLEQLIAESSGKNGKGIVPIVGEHMEPAAFYPQDRLFVYLRYGGQKAEQVESLQVHGHPVIVLPITNPYDIGGEFYRWEIAIAIACSILGVNGFDQPDVQDSKTRTIEKIKKFKQTGQLIEQNPLWEGEGVRIYGSTGFLGKEESLDSITKQFLSKANKRDYIAINAYLPRNSRTAAQLNKLRIRIQKLTGLATTLGFGPRFLHSTGQLHKGGANNGLFIQITSEVKKDIQIPNQGFSFGILERAQSLGDLEALEARQRRTMRIHLVDKSLDDLLNKS